MTPKPGVTGQVATFIRGDSEKHQSKPRTTGYFSRPIAPSHWLVLLAVLIVATAMLAVVAKRSTNDLISAFSCFLILMAGAAVLDANGRRRAAKKPHPIYRPDGLPQTKSDNKIKTILLVLVFVALVAYVSNTATADDFGSPMPYFLAAEFLVLVMPQLLAYRAMRQLARRGQ